MYISKTDAEKLLRKTVCGLVDELREKGDFLHGLLKQDDWSFVIKAHALLEAAITQMVIANVGNEQLASFIERLPLGGQFGKIKLCEQLDLLPDAHRRFARWFSEFRNPLVHRLDKVTFTFGKHVKGFKADEARRWVDSVVWFSKDDPKTQKAWKLIVRTAPKHTLFMGLYLIIGECIIRSHDSKAKRAIHDTSERTMKSLFPASQVGYKSPYISRCKEIIEAYIKGDDKVPPPRNRANRKLSSKVTNRRPRSKPAANRRKISLANSTS
jgi:hypothetical protein